LANFQTSTASPDCYYGNGKAVYKVKKQDERFPFFDWQNAGVHLGGVASSIVKDLEGNIWVGFDLAFPQLIHHDRKTGKTVSVLDQDAVEGFLIQNIRSLSLDREGNLWIGAQNEVLRRDAKTGKFRRYNNLWKSPDIQDRDGYLWISDNGAGLFRLDPKTGAFINFRQDASRPESISGNNVQNVFEDVNGNIWVGGGGFSGSFPDPLFLDRLNPNGKSFTHFLKKEEVGALPAQRT
jgi:ligand-binding sensor domain-containing protein